MVSRCPRWTLYVFQRFVHLALYHCHKMPRSTPLTLAPPGQVSATPIPPALLNVTQPAAVVEPVLAGGGLVSAIPPGGGAAVTIEQAIQLAHFTCNTGCKSA
ncbi:hypothetical protein Vafri_18430 [Volvox africanus]|uniref:Uncharacterized protein n=1 Tax=Volvox africanus TaxID=51714 RepID=A0A8J4BMJ9_9CHLO|nr:hypothetical protein Vafri_18430 [Volvox africanus]